MSLRAHLENVDRLIDLQDTRLLAMEQEFEKDLHTIETEFGAEKEAITKHHAAEGRAAGRHVAEHGHEELRRQRGGV